MTTRERKDLLETLDKHRGFLRFTARELTDAQATQRTTASSLTIAGLIKHVAATEHAWLQFVVGGARRDGRQRRRLRKPVHQVAGRDAREPAGALRRRSRAKRARSSTTCPTWMPTIRCPRRPGSNRVHAGPHGGCCSTSSPRRRSTPATRTSSASRWTAPRRWADRALTHTDKRPGWRPSCPST